MVEGKLLWASGVTPGGSADLTGNFRGTIDFGGRSPSAAVGGSDPFGLVYGP